MTADEPRRRGTGWIVVSAILLILAGANVLLNGLFALHADTAIQNNVKNALLFSSNNLDTWGWIFIIVGAVIVVAGFAVFGRARWAVYVGTLAAFLGIVISFFWLFTPYWPDAMISIVLAGFVLYGLGNYGIDDTAPV